MAEYTPVPVQAARDISRLFGKQIVVIVSFDRVFGLLHTTTFGEQAEDKHPAAVLGEILAAAAGSDLSKATSFEDFRSRTVAEWAREKDDLLGQIRSLEGQLAKARS
jgi:hypothetical protein